MTSALKIQHDTLNNELIALGKAVIDVESKAVQTLHARINDNFAKACRLILSCKGRLIVTGVGKSGHIASKIAATMASTGTPAFFVHAGEATHGDMGTVTRDDVVLAISHSGKSEEILKLLPSIKRLEIPLITLSGYDNSPLAKAASVHLDVSVNEEACPLGLAPTSSTTATLVMGDALCIALLKARGFTADDFALSHPGGTLGRRLLLLVEDIMHTSDAIPMVQSNAILSEVLVEMTQKSLGMTAVVDAQRHVLGIFTDGDLRRTLNKGFNVHQITVSEVMTAHCKTMQGHSLAIDALTLMEKHKINALLVTDSNNCLIGALNMHDLLRAGVL